MRIDLLTSIDGVEFAEAHDRRALVAVGATQVRVISRGDLVANKRAGGQLQDLADVERLLESDQG